MKIARALALALLATSAAALPRDDPAATFAALRDVDARMAGIAYRLTTANAPLCRDLVPVAGWAIHGLGQYDPALRDAARASFGFETPIAVEAVVPGGPAARAGVAANDSLAAINGTPLDAAPGAKADSRARDATNMLVARQSPRTPLRVDLVRDGKSRTVAIAAVAGCPSSFEVLLGPGMAASADGSIVQVAVRFFERYSDDQVAVVVAHELAHNILRHRARLDAAKVNRGLLAEIGRNGRLFRRTEAEADLLGVHLLRNAGYDPQSAVAFWRDHGGDVDGGLFRSRTHPASKARAAAIAAELARLPAAAPRPYVPAILADRDVPLQ
jgi:predicted metallopeptidase